MDRLLVDSVVKAICAKVDMTNAAATEAVSATLAAIEEVGWDIVPNQRKSMELYTVEVFWSNADEAYIAIAPDLPGTSAVGDTRADAVRQVEDVIFGWLSACKKSGNAVPEPTKHKSLDSSE